MHSALQSLPALSTRNASNRPFNSWRFTTMVLGTVVAISPITFALASAQSATITISIELLMSLKLKTVSARSISLPVETSTAASKVARRILSTALSPSLTFVTLQPARVRQFSTSSQLSEQTSKVLSNRRGKLTTETSNAYRSANERLTSSRLSLDATCARAPVPSPWQGPTLWTQSRCQRRERSDTMREVYNL